MSGVERGQLPTKIQDVLDITSAVRQILLRGCRFGEFGEGWMSYPEVDRALENCTVRPDEKERLQGLVMRHDAKTPIPIPADVDICFGLVEPDRACNKHLTINVNEVDVNFYFMTYVTSLCQLHHVTVLLPDVVTYFDALNLIASRMNPNGYLELECLVDINSPLTMNALIHILRAYETLRVSSRDAIVHDGNFTRIPERLRFGRVLVEQSIPARKMAQLQSVSDSIVGELNPRIQPAECQQVVINLLDSNLSNVVKYWSKHCFPGMIERLICEGHVAGEESADQTWTNHLDQILDLGRVVEIPSIHANDRVFDQDDLRGAQLHIKEVVVDSEGINSLWKFIKDRSLIVGRWVLTYDAPADTEGLNAVVEQLGHRQTVYIFLRDVSVESLQVASSINARNYIVDERFRNDTALAQFLTISKNVIFRTLARSSEPLTDADFAVAW
jgi:hypothetical protein